MHVGSLAPYRIVARSSTAEATSGNHVDSSASARNTLETIRPLKGCHNPAGFPLSESFRLSDFDGYIKYSLFQSDNGHFLSKKCDISTNSQNEDKSLHNVVQHVLMHDIVHAC